MWATSEVVGVGPVVKSGNKKCDLLKISIIPLKYNWYLNSVLAANYYNVLNYKAMITKF